MKVVALSGSMRKHGSTHTLVEQVLAEMTRLNPDIVAERIYVADAACAPCRVTCSRFCTEHPYQCSIADDVPGILQQMMQADALLLAAPLYFRGPPAHFQALMERLISMFYFHESQGSQYRESPLQGKPCGLIGMAEYSNPHQVLEYLHDACCVLKLNPLRLDRFPYLGVGGQGNVKDDHIFCPFERAQELAEALVAA